MLNDGSMYYQLPNVCIDTVAVTDKPCMTRILSRTITCRDDIFRARVRERDGKCVTTGTVNSKAYIDVSDFVVSRPHYFLSSAKNISRNTDFLGGLRKHDTGINSCQNGLLCSPISIRVWIVLISLLTQMTAIK
ncbi:hypothetical protein V1509DRAFT_414176 [Lipomyces kononenkoae]